MLSSFGRENEFLNLGPYSKNDVAQSMLEGAELTFITEYTSFGVEVRCAAGTNKTANAQREYFEMTKEPGNMVVVGAPPDRVALHLARMEG